jgi:hypothetical protein
MLCDGCWEEHARTYSVNEHSPMRLTTVKSPRNRKGVAAGAGVKAPVTGEFTVSDRCKAFLLNESFKCRHKEANFLLSFE